MDFEETIPYFYADQALRDFWAKWSETALNRKQNPADSFQRFLGSSNANDRTRAGELYDIGVLRGVLVTPQYLGKTQPLGWTMLVADEPVHTRLGYLSYLIGKTKETDNEAIFRAFSVLCGLFCLQIGYKRSDGVQFSYASLIEYLKLYFPLPSGVQESIWLRYLAAGMFSTIHSFQGESLIENMLAAQPVERLIFRWQDGTELDSDYTVFCDVVREQQSISTLRKPKHNLFFIGSDANPRGIYSQALQYCREFLQFYASEEIRQLQQGKRGKDCFNYTFLHKDPLQETPDVVNELQQLAYRSPNWQRNIIRLMKTLQDGCIEAISILYGPTVAEQIQSKAIITQTEPTPPLPNLPRNKILFGAPGTGKSSKIKNEYAKGHITRRVTFHPDYEYGSFVGAYKPVSAINAQTGQKEIHYEFVPQEFIKTYCDAWNNPGQAYFLIIEEINRGNCAQIFGDLFQSLGI
jgi:hypothetical protein